MLHRRLAAKGFTLIEAMIALTIISMVAGLGLFASMQTYRASLMRSEISTIHSALLRARSQAMTSGTAHGLCVEEEAKAYELYAGAPDISIARFPMSPTATVSGMPDCTEGGIAFSPYAATTTGGRIVVAEGGATRTISVNYEGWIDAPN